MKLIFAPLLISCTLLLSCEKEYSAEGGPASAIMVLTNGVTAITTSTAVSGGSVISSGGSPVLERGVCWSITTSPTILNNRTIDGSGTGSFISDLNGLLPNTNYFVRAYITTVTGTIYGPEKTFKTLDVTAPPLIVGSNYGGGIIGYVLQPGDAGYDPAVPHGIIIAPETNTLIDWSLQDFGTFVLTNATGTAIGTGQVNTNKIIPVEGPGIYAAQYCNDLVLNGYSDWYLPSKDELFALWQNRATIGGFPNSAYWSSTETDITAANFLLIISGNANMSSGYKGSPAYVRAVRGF